MRFEFGGGIIQSFLRWSTIIREVNLFICKEIGPNLVFIKWPINAFIILEWKDIELNSWSNDKNFIKKEFYFLRS